MKALIERWRKDAAQYRKQVIEARAVGSPHEAMLCTAITLENCAKELEAAIEPLPGEN